MKSTGDLHRRRPRLLPGVLHLAAALLLPVAALAKGGVIGSPHDLSRNRGGETGRVFTEETRVCVFCHVPHNARQPRLLWSRAEVDTWYANYSSSTLQAEFDQPTGSSRLCLSCHDGTIALGNFAGSRIAQGEKIPEGADLTTDLSDDHPISLVYSHELAVRAALRPPTELSAYGIRLDGGGELQCTACHDPHDNQYGKFLTIDNRLPGSPLCVACHQPEGWETAVHNPALSSSALLDPGCLSCHDVHAAARPEQLLRAVQEEAICFTCHGDDGSEDAVDLKTLFSAALYRHPLTATTGAHDAREPLPTASYHVECVDCHNPHQSRSTSESALSGALQGVRIDTVGTFAQHEYEICYKCHAGPAAAGFRGVSFEEPPNRTLNEDDQSLRFSDSNPSAHPVTRDRRGNGASLRGSLQTTMLRIACSDCHNSDDSTRAGGGGPDGPHGSNYPRILLARYEMPLKDELLAGDARSLYALCFRCHDDTYLLESGTAFAGSSGNLHARHVEGGQIPCYACHDPHGVAGFGAALDGTRLINFAVDYAGAGAAYNSSAIPTCTVSCHGSTAIPYQ